MAPHAHTHFRFRKSDARQTTYSRCLRFEPLEDRRMLSIIADTFDPAFAQVSRIVGTELTVLTVDPSGHFAIFYRPNTELGYINPETGDLLTANVFPGTSAAGVIDAVIGGGGSADVGFTNVSQLVGIHYSNGQLIEDASNTMYHLDGSVMHSGATWTYDAGANLGTTAGNYFWVNGNSMKSGSVYKHFNGATLRNNSGTIFYASSNAFYDSSTLGEFYVSAIPIRNTSGVYLYETGGQLDNSNVIFYPNASVMVDQSGNVYDGNGAPASTPFSQYHTFTASEVTTTVSNVDSLTTIASKQTFSGSAGAYVVRIHLAYAASGDYDQDKVVDAPDYVLWRKNLGSDTALPNDNTPGVGQDDYDRWRANFGQTAVAIGAGAGLIQTLADAGSLTTTQHVLSIGPAEPVLQVAVADEFSDVGHRLETDRSVTVLDQSEANLQLLTVVADWQPPASTPNDQATVSAVDSAPRPSDPALNSVDDAFALLSADL
jgi:hypothetical protein